MAEQQKDTKLQILEAAIGAALASPEAEAEFFAAIDEAMITDETLRKVYAAQKARYLAGNKSSPELIEQDTHGAVQADYLRRLVSIGQFSIDLLEANCAEIRKWYRIRKAHQTLLVASAALQAGDVEKWEATLAADLEDSLADKTEIAHGDMLETQFKALAQQADNKQLVGGGSLGLPSLDQVILGLNPGDVMIVGGKPGSGKSALALQMTRHIAQSGKKVRFQSYEMSEKQVNMRLAALATGINTTVYKTVTLAGEEWQVYADYVDNERNLPITWDFARDLKVDALFARSRRQKATSGLDVLVIDHLQEMENAHDDGRGNSGHPVIKFIVRRLRTLARKLGVAVIILSQMNRASDSRQDQRPRLSDLKESGAIEEVADVVLFLYRENPDPDNHNVTLIVAKNRDGVAGVDVPVYFNAKYQQFVDLGDDAPR